MDPKIFSPAFLDALSQREGRACTDLEALSTGPFRVEKHGNRFAVWKDSDSEDDPHLGEFAQDQHALLLAATKGAEYRDHRLCVSEDRDENGLFRVWRRYRSGIRTEFVGWMPGRNLRELEAMHTAEYILRSPYRMANFLEAAGHWVLREASKILARRFRLRDPGTRHVDESEVGRIVSRYRLEVVEEKACTIAASPLKTCHEQAQWLAQVIPRSPVEIGGGLYLDAYSRPIGYTQYDGGSQGMQLEPRHIFAPALLLNAASVTVWHTHPELEPSPSNRDREWTLIIRRCGQDLGIPVLASLVLGAGEQHASIPIR